ncbi:3-hydroxyisobutyryl-CoA hydrolase 1-like isoform X2 [Malania oleifera]|uniref:3-hydroxyisobutyryl-CoA hydrolase 1-like isoform X2 n=1 Tax=Malania oleifera TaxID=397392 RepID=UPI0025AE57FA|nr:3-hydroxyisobutyryl-CoA hydrolase 1-like isoform X2 [Malania oleifera]
MATPRFSEGDFDQVLVEENRSARTYTLNRPRQLNALSYQMVAWLLKLFLHCEKESNAKLVILKGRVGGGGNAFVV